MRAHVSVPLGVAAIGILLFVPIVVTWACVAIGLGVLVFLITLPFDLHLHGFPNGFKHALINGSVTCYVVIKPNGYRDVRRWRNR